MTDARTLRIITPAKTYDLVTLDQAKAELSINPTSTDQEDWLVGAISQMSDSGAKEARRVFPIEVVQETILRGTGSLGYGACLPPFGVGGRPNLRTLRLRRWPLIRVQSLLENGIALVEGADFMADYESAVLTRLSNGFPISWLAPSIVVTYGAGFARQTVTSGPIPVPPAPPTITVTNFEIDCGVTDASGSALVSVASSPADGQYAASSAGVYTFNPIDAGDTVNITSGSTLIPGDIQEASLRMLTMRYRAKGRDPMQMSRTQGELGEQRFWVGGMPGQEGPFPPEIAAVFHRYRPQRFG